MNDSINERNKQLVWDYWQALQSAQPADVSATIGRYCSDNHRWHGFDPVGSLDGADGLSSGFWAPLRESIPDLERKTWLFFGGKSSGRVDGSNDGRMWATGTGVFSGTFANDYLSIPATGSRVEIRWGEFCRVDENRIVETFFLIDMIDRSKSASCFLGLSLEPLFFNDLGIKS